MHEEKKDLKVLVTASDRLKKTNFKGFDLKKDPKSLKTKKVRQNKMHLKFPLYTDEQIGFTGLKNRGSNLVNSNADEDYETDKEILRKTKLVCKRDVFQALKFVLKHPSTF